MAFKTSELQHSGMSLPHLVADPSGEQRHELGGLVALHVSVLDGVSAQEVVQLSGQHGTRHLLIPRRLLTCGRKERKHEAQKTLRTKETL